MFEHWKKRRAHWERMVHKRGADILKSANMQKEKKFLQHGKVSVYTHSVRVAVLSLFLAELLRVKVNEEAMMRGLCFMIISCMTGMKKMTVTDGMDFLMPEQH